MYSSSQKLLKGRFTPTSIGWSFPVFPAGIKICTKTSLLLWRSAYWLIDCLIHSLVHRLIDWSIDRTWFTPSSSNFSALESFLWTVNWSRISTVLPSASEFPKVWSIHIWSKRSFHQPLRELHTITLSAISSFFIIPGNRTPVFTLEALNTMTAGSLVPSARAARETVKVFFSPGGWVVITCKTLVDWLIEQHYVVEIRNKILIPYLLHPNLVDGSLVWRNIPHASLVHIHYVGQLNPFDKDFFVNASAVVLLVFLQTINQSTVRTRTLVKGLSYTGSQSINHSIETLSHVTLSSSVSSIFKNVWVDLRCPRRFFFFILVIHPSNALNSGWFCKIAMRRTAFLTSEFMTTNPRERCCRIQTPTSFPTWSYIGTLFFFLGSLGPSLKGKERSTTDVSMIHRLINIQSINQSIEGAYRNQRWIQTREILSLSASDRTLPPTSRYLATTRWISSAEYLFRDRLSIGKGI